MQKDIIIESLSLSSESMNFKIPSEILEIMAYGILTDLENGFYSPPPSDNINHEIRLLKDELEKATRITYENCDSCFGSGYVTRKLRTSEGNIESFDFKCLRCRGEGKIKKVGYL